MVQITAIKLDKIDLTILAELDKDCRIPTTTLARIVRKSRQTVEYRINNLVERGIITGFQTAINPHKMGLKLYKIYLKLKNIPSDKQELIKYLRTSPITQWMGECSGTWDMIFGVFVKTDYDFFTFKNEFLSKFSKIIIDEYGESLIDVTQYPKTYFTNTTASTKILAGEIVNNALDEIDYEILEQVVNNARIPIIQLASKVKSTATIVLGRLRKLEKNGIIIQYRIGVNLNKLGLELYKTIIKLERYNKEDEKKLYYYLSNIPNIQYFIRNIWQIELELVVNNYQEYYRIIEDLKKNFSDVIRTADAILMITDEWTPGFKNLLKK